MRITATTVALLLPCCNGSKASKAPAKGSKKGKGKSGKGTAAPTGVPTEGPTAAPTGALCTSANSFNNTSLRAAVKDYFGQGCITNTTCEIIIQNGVIGGWKTCEVTEMNSLFATYENPEAADFNESLNNWDVSKVTNMRFMFNSAAAYNQPMNDWDVSKVTDMYIMFGGAAAYNQPLNDWEVSNVTNLFYMFYEAVAFNQNLCDWGTKLQPTADVFDMFYGTGCANKGAPDLSLVPRGPFCADCSVVFV